MKILTFSDRMTLSGQNNFENSIFPHSTNKLAPIRTQNPSKNWQNLAKILMKSWLLALKNHPSQQIIAPVCFRLKYHVKVKINFNFIFHEIHNFSKSDFYLDQIGTQSQIKQYSRIIILLLNYLIQFWYSCIFICNFINIVRHSTYFCHWF